MADRWAVASGNWSSTATWNGGTLPTASDDVFADGFTVTIDQNVTVLSIRTTQRSGGTAGGGFTLNAGFNVTANVTAGTTACVNITHSGVNTITGNISGSTASGVNCVDKGGAGTLNIIGNITGGTASSSQGLRMQGGIVSITGNIQGGSASAAHGIEHNQVGGSLSIIGSVTGGSAIAGNSAHGLRFGSGNSGTITITGNVTGGSISNNFGVGLTNNPNITFTLNGNCIANASAGISGSQSNITIINGNIIASDTTHGLANSGSGFVVVNGNCISSSNGYPGVYATRMLIHPTTTLQHAYRVNNGGVAGAERSLYTGGVNLNQPTVTNVRSGTVYGASNEFTGTLVVPSAQFVALGTPVDSGVGTLQYLTMSDLQSALQSNAPTVNERTLSDTNPLSFSWPVSGVITGQVSKNNGAYANVQGAISYLRFEGNRHYYSLAYNAADRPTQEGVARYKFTDGTYTRYANLRVYPAPNNTAIESINSRLPANPASAQQITSLQNNAPTEIF